jgi:N-acetylated-alpha-linked acidic dipeptidase
LADSFVLPLEFGHFANTLTSYLEEIQKEAKTKGQTLDFASLVKQIEMLRQNAKEYDTFLALAMQRNSLDRARASAVNDALIQTERALTRPEGLPNRELYKHQIYAPGFYSGYGVKTVPGVREAADSKDWTFAQKETAAVEQCLAQMNQVVGEAIIGLSGM